MDLLTVFPANPDERYIDKAVKALRDGKLIMYPTDTLYAIGCDALNQRAIEALCRLKGLNPAKQLLSVVCSDFSQAAEYARIDNAAFKIMRQNGTAGITYILPATTHLPKAFKGRRTVGVRIPDNRVATMLASGLGNPVLSASVNVDDTDDIVNPEYLAAAYGHDVAVVLAAGEGGSVPSTIVDLTDPANPEIVRQGIARVDI